MTSSFGQNEKYALKNKLMLRFYVVLRSPPIVRWQSVHKISKGNVKMITRNFIGIILGSLIMSLPMVVAQESATGSGEASDDTAAGQKVVHVCSLNSTEANQEFQRNVRLMQLQRQNVVELKARLDSSTDAQGSTPSD